MKIYTKTGDKGETGIIGGRISKASQTIEMLGSLDELNAGIGVINAMLEDHNEMLIKVQNDLFSIGSVVAGAEIDLKLTKTTEDLENHIDKMEKELNPLQNFILPGGSKNGAFIHYIRSVTRRVERIFTAYKESSKLKKEDLKQISIFLNRLSDFLFVLARFENKKKGEQEIIWSK